LAVNASTTMAEFILSVCQNNIEKGVDPNEWK
jgi:hypothetical protein